MELQNESPFRARLISGQRSPADDVHCAALVKQTFAVHTDGRTSIAAEQLPVGSSPIETPFGTVPGDEFLRREGVDVCVLGTVRPTAPCERVVVSLRVGALVRRLRVSGERRWYSDGRALQPTAPVPFTAIPLTYAHAYGGTVEWSGVEVPYAANPKGIGFYLSHEQALGNRLPNIEYAEAPELARWEERLAPAGWAPYPVGWALASPNTIRLSPSKKAIAGVLPRLYNAAHPDLIFRTGQAAAGTRVHLEGMTSDPFGFEVPSAPRVDLDIGGRCTVVEAELDGLLLFPDARRAAVTWRARFRYPFARGEGRRAIVR
jgi:hypothetical protein